MERALRLEWSPIRGGDGEVKASEAEVGGYTPVAYMHSDPTSGGWWVVNKGGVMVIVNGRPLTEESSTMHAGRLAAEAAVERLLLADRGIAALLDPSSEALDALATHMAEYVKTAYEADPFVNTSALRSKAAILLGHFLDDATAVRVLEMARNKARNLLEGDEVW